jgi:hypothetical protein
MKNPTRKKILASDAYSFTVTFTRYARDDIECAKTNFPKIKETRKLLLQQLRTELQAAYDETGMAGHFDIDEFSFKLLDVAPARKKKGKRK